MIGKDNRYRLLPKKYMASRILGKLVRPDFKVNSLDMRVFETREAKVSIFLWGLSSGKKYQETDGRVEAVDCHEVVVPNDCIFVYLEKRCTGRRTSKR